MFINQPLVSVVLITYNSEKFVLETLESIKAQSYRNIELIISDDASNDNTVAKCQEWINKNSNRFIRIQLIVTEENTGISANINRGCNAAEGEWIKSVAGDDALEKECISQYIEFINNNHDALICHSKQYCYIDTFNPTSLSIKNEICIPSCLKSSTPNSRRQFLYLCLSNPISAPSIFMKKSLYDSIGGYDENIPMCEDYPMWLKITRKGIPFYYLDKYTILYRIHSSSVFGTSSINYLFKRFFQYDNDTYNKYIKSFSPLIIKLTNRYEYNLRRYLDKFNLNNLNAISKTIFSLLIIPYRLLFKIIVLYYGLNSKK